MLIKVCFHKTGLSLYGVQRNINPSSLASGWLLCHLTTCALIMTSNSLLSTLCSCYKDKLLPGCRAVGTKNVTRDCYG